jgi:hypothetical protein
MAARAGYPMLLNCSHSFSEFAEMTEIVCELNVAGLVESGFLGRAGLKESGMLLRKRNKIIASICAAGFLMSSSAASAAAVPQTVDPWLALSAMSSSSSSAVSTAASAQSDAAYESGFRAPPWPALAVIIATLALAIYLLVDEDDDDVNVPLSPA